MWENVLCMRKHVRCGRVWVTYRIVCVCISSTPRDDNTAHYLRLKTSGACCGLCHAHTRSAFRPVKWYTGGRNDVL